MCFSVIISNLSNVVLGNSRKLVIRFLTGAWCLSCFVLVTAYSSVLISFLTAPEVYKPLINSMNDLPNKSYVRVTVNKGLFADVALGVKASSN